MTQTHTSTSSLRSPMSKLKVLSPSGIFTGGAMDLGPAAVSEPASVDASESTDSPSAQGDSLMGFQGSDLPSDRNACQKDIACILPSDSMRYERGIRIEEHDKPIIVDPLFTGYHHKPEPANWKSFVQAEGQLYFVSQGGAPRFITEEYLYDEEVRNEVDKFMRTLEEQIRVLRNHGGWDKRDVVIEIRGDHWAYYIADHEHQCVMWLESKDLSDLSSQCQGIESMAHLRFAIESEYYVHMERFPHVQELPEGLLGEICGILVHSGTDAITSLESTIAYSTSELQQLLTYFEYLQNLHSKGQAKEYVISSAARIMAICSIERYFAFYGVHGAKLSSEMHVRAREKSRTWLARVLSPLLFFAPEIHLESLEKIWIDRTVKHVPWKTYVEKLDQEWSVVVLSSSVLLIANVAFLATPAINNNMTVVPLNSTITGAAFSDQNNSDELSTAAVADIISIILSLCGIVVALILTRYHLSKAKKSAHEAANYLLRWEGAVSRLETLAITYSLPYAMLMWSMVAFIVAVCATCLNVNGNIQRIIFAFAWFLVASIVLWTIFTSCEQDRQSHWRGLRAFPVLKRFKRFLRRVGNDGSDEAAGSGSEGNCDEASGRAHPRRTFVQRLKWEKFSHKRASVLQRRLPQDTTVISSPAQINPPQPQRSSLASLQLFYSNYSQSNASIRSTRTERGNENRSS